MKVLLALIVGSIALPLVIVLVGVLGWLPSTATSSPPGIETSIAGRALDASLERRADGLKNPIQANDTAQLTVGKQIYADKCAGCHGDAKGPSAWGSKGLYPRVPQFVQEGSDLTSEEAYAAIHDGIRYSGMGAWRDLMKEDDMWRVANFVAHIRAAGDKSPDTDRK